eukprot:m.294623 g.294623  ORF g.294623 m.294623 type:complete len:205 (-) comp48000_c0_seq1:179-793(-)
MSRRRQGDLVSKDIDDSSKAKEQADWRAEETKKEYANMPLDRYDSDLIGAIVYNINHMSDFALGEPTTFELALYSDVVWANQGGAVRTLNYLTDELEYTDHVNGTNLNGAYYPRRQTLSDEQWKAGSWFLFNQKWLPFFAPARDVNGDYAVRHLDHAPEDAFTFNPASQQVLLPTLLSLAKVLGIGLGAYYGVLMGVRVVKKVL